MIKGLLLCLAVLAVQLGLLHYIDLRVATMVRLKDPTSEPLPVPPRDTPADAGFDA